MFKNKKKIKNRQKNKEKMFTKRGWTLIWIFNISLSLLAPLGFSLKSWELIFALILGSIIFLSFIGVILLVLLDSFVHPQLKKQIIKTKKDHQIIEIIYNQKQNQIFLTNTNQKTRMVACTSKEIKNFALMNNLEIKQYLKRKWPNALNIVIE